MTDKASSMMLFLYIGRLKHWDIVQEIASVGCQHHALRQRSLQRFDVVDLVLWSIGQMESIKD